MWIPIVIPWRSEGIRWRPIYIRFNFVDLLDGRVHQLVGCRRYGNTSVISIYHYNEKIKPYSFYPNEGTYSIIIIFLHWLYLQLISSPLSLVSSPEKIVILIQCNHKLYIGDKWWKISNQEVILFKIELKKNIRTKMRVSFSKIIWDILWRIK